MSAPAAIQPRSENGRLILDYHLCACIGMDAGNRSMRKACRKRWSQDDANAAARAMAVAAWNSGLIPERVFQDMTGRTPQQERGE